LMIIFNVSALSSIFMASVASALLTFLCVIFYITYHYCSRFRT
jgi:hypothetical protein